MVFNTYQDILLKLNNDLDLTNEDFVSTTELLGYMNEAIDDAQKAIHNLGHEDKYFLTNGTIPIGLGLDQYSLPADIYANKIRKLFYINGSTQYEINKIRLMSEIPFITSSDQYRYLIINPSAGQQQIQLFPAAQETSSTHVQIWYIREANKLTTAVSADNICDIPESTNFIYAHCKYSIALKKPARADLIQVRENAMTRAYNLMLESLQEFTVDENNRVIMDLSSYADQEMGW